MQVSITENGEIVGSQIGAAVRTDCSLSYIPKDAGETTVLRGKSVARRGNSIFFRGKSVAPRGNSIVTASRRSIANR
jgi:hypothetical protein